MSNGRPEGVLRSRCLRRCCPRRSSGSDAGGVKLSFPETPLVLAGALGGPFCIFVLTPLRNALTLASQDIESSAWKLYESTFQGGFTSGWTGGLAPVLPSCPQFCVMGPLFHFLKAATGSVVLAVLLSATAETTISYGSQTLNAQLAFNQEQLNAGTGLEVGLWNPLVPFGPGSTTHVIRNIVALSGIRIFSSPCQELLSKAARACGIGELPDGARHFFGDLIASIGAAMLSAPLNQLYNFAVTSEAYLGGDFTTRIEELLGFLARSYLVRSPEGDIVGLSPTLARDLFMRCAYVATLFTLFANIERAAVMLWKRRGQHPKMTRRGTVGVRASS